MSWGSLNAVLVMKKVLCHYVAKTWARVLPQVPLARLRCTARAQALEGFPSEQNLKV